MTTDTFTALCMPSHWLVALRQLMMWEVFLNRWSCQYLHHIFALGLSSTYCSRLLAYLAWGSLSVREVVQSTKQKITTWYKREKTIWTPFKRIELKAGIALSLYTKNWRPIFYWNLLYSSCFWGAAWDPARWTKIQSMGFGAYQIPIYWRLHAQFNCQRVDYFSNACSAC